MTYNSYMDTDNILNTATLSIRELTRSSSILQNYDYIEIEDRKSHRSKGLFIPIEYANDVKNYLNEKLLKERIEKKKTLMTYAGIATGDFGQESYAALISKKDKKYGD